jgi:hypothetical protein
VRGRDYLRCLADSADAHSATELINRKRIVTEEEEAAV